ncbi:hypothetical protein [Nocardia sp. NPDC057440]|uniref:hypothetical protein n=1 Tax=Nocardia sp. NPDC057440 TaxID=3346134 RepID=UPI003672C1AB
MARKMTSQMRTVLNALYEYEGIIHPGTTAGEIVQAGGSRDVLYRAVRKGYANRYIASRYSDRPEAPLYYRTEAGTDALNDAINATPEGVSNEGVGMKGVHQ